MREVIQDILSVISLVGSSKEQVVPIVESLGITFQRLEKCLNL